MKLKDIFVLSLQRVGEIQGDRQIENIIMAGINSGYKIIATKNKKTKNTSISAELNTPIILPNDFIDLVLLQKEGVSGGRLAEEDYFLKEDILLVTNPDLIGDLNLYYTFIPNDLVRGTDDENEPQIQTAYHQALASYAAYYYFVFKNNINTATMCLNEFNAITGLAESISQPQTQTTK